MTSKNSSTPNSIPTGWRPSEGDSITGTVVDFDRGWSDQQDAFYPILTLNTSDGEVNVHCFHSILKQRVAQISPKIGDELTIVFHGKKPTRDGKRTAAHYTVTSPQYEVPANFWDQFTELKRDWPEYGNSDTPPPPEEIPF